MDSRSDLALVRQHAASGSNEAFEAVVSRHLGMVHSAALRQLGNVHQAEEVCHAVFLALARKAGSLPDGTIVAGWLFRAARFAAAKLARDEERRARREREAAMTHAESLAEVDHDKLWEQVTPLLNEALDSLAERDRDAVLLRFFQNRPFAEVAAELETSEAAAKMRVGRAVEKLREHFRRRGVVVGAVAISGALSARAAETAGVELAAAVTTTATQGGTAALGSAALAASVLQGLTFLWIRRWLWWLATLVVVGGLLGGLAYWLNSFAPAAPAAPWP